MMANNEDLQIKCLEPDEGAQKSSSLLTVFDTLKDQSFIVAWLSQEQCLQIERRERNMLFVVDPFDGPAFHHLASLGCRVVGPQCVLTTLQLKISVPRRRQPIYNLAMKDICVSCSSVEKSVRELIYKRVEMMGGLTSKDLTDIVTHLVVGEVGSQKYRVAADNGRSIVTPDWVEAVWERSQYRHVHASDEQFKKYKCPVFRGLSVTVSGLSSEERHKIREAIEKEGGRYSGEMKMQECTHLIVHEPKGQKYQFAKKWQINIVRPAWVFDSVEKGYCMCEDNYSVKSGSDQTVKTSTPERDNTSGREFGDISAISVVSVSTMISTVNETGVPGQTTFRASIEPNASTTEPQEQKSILPVMEDDADLSMASRDLLEGFRVYISGFNNDDFERLCKMVNTSGGIRTDDLDKLVTHVIQGDTVPKDVDTLLGGLVNAHVVSVAWLLDSLQQGHLLKETAYYKEGFPRPKPRAAVQSPCGDASAANAPSLSKSLPSDQSSRQSQLTQGDKTLQPCQDEVDGEVGGKGDVGVEGKMENMAHEKQEEILDLYLPQDVQNAEEPSGEVDEEVGGIFHGKTFKLFGFEEEQLAELTDYIFENGGTALGDDGEERSTADYGIVPITGFPVPAASVRQLLTNAWLQMCIEGESLLPLDRNRLFHPLELSTSSLPLQGCVLSVSGYSGTERDSLIHIAELLGATCQEFFVRKPKKNLEASTHLVCKVAEGSKFGAAKKWGLPAITKHWLFACVDADRLVAEEDFLVENADQTTLPEDDRHTSVTMDKRQSLAPVPGTSASGSNSTSASVGKKSRLSLHTKPVEEDRNRSVKETSAVAASDDAGDETAWETSVKPNASLHSSGVVSCGGRSPGEGSGVPVKAMSSKTHLAGKAQQDKDHQAASSRDSGLGRRNSLTAQNDARDAVDVDVPAGAVQSSSTENTQCDRRGDSNPLSEALGSVVRGALLKESQRENVLQQQVTPTAQPRPQHSRVKELQDSFGQRTPAPAASPCNAGVVTPGQFLAEGKKYMPHFNIKNALADLESPEAAEHRRRSSVSLDQVFSEALAAGVQNSAITRATAKGSADSQASNTQEDAGPLHGVIIAVSKKLASKQTEYNEIAKGLGGSYIWSYNGSCTHFIFQGRANDMSKEFRVAREHGVKIVCPQWLLMCKETNARVEESFFPHNYNPHLALSCVTPAGVRRSARTTFDPSHSDQKRVPGSIKKRRLQTDHGPLKGLGKEAPTAEAKGRASCTHAPPLSSPPPSPLPKEPGSSPTHLRTPSNSADPRADSNPAQAEEVQAVEMESGGTLEMREALNRQVEDLISNTAKAQKKNRRKNRRLDSSSNTSTGSPESRRLSRTKQEAREPEKPDQSSLPEGSQFVQVSWDDPVRRMEQERLADKLQEACASSQDTENTDQFLANLDLPDREDLLPSSRKNKYGSTPDPPSLRYPYPKSAQSGEAAEEGGSRSKPAHSQKPAPVFIVSSMQPSERNDYAALVVKLGGQLLDKQYFDPSCTHLVVGVPGRNEKFLAAVASGRWVLHKSYFEECQKVGRFVQEDPHEWGGEGTKALTKALNPSVTKLVAAAQRWRLTLSAQKKENPSFQGAFDGWRVLLATDKNKEGSFLRLLQAGGATVLPFSSPVPKNVNATHAFFDLEKRPIPEEDLMTLLLADVHCLKPDFIASHLMEHPPPSPPDFYPSQIATLLLSLSESHARKRRQQRASNGSSKRPKRT